MKIFIINLERAKDRRQFQIKQAIRYNLNIEFIEAIDYRNLAKSHLENAADHWTRPITGKDIGCYHSHRKAWDAVVKHGKPSLIIEDDIIFSKSISDILQIIENDQFNKNRVYDLEYAPVPHRIGKKPIQQDIDKNIFFNRMYINKIGAGAYIIHPYSAAKLLKKTSNYVMIDSYLWTRPWIEQVQVEPCPAAQMRDINPNTDNQSITQSTTDSTYTQKSWVKKKIIRIRLTLDQIKAASLYLLYGTKRHLRINKEEFILQDLST